MPIIHKEVRKFMTLYIEERKIPKEWKTARLILLRKEGKPREKPSSYRPICLLNEIEKMLERIIVNRITEHLENKGPDLNEKQFGFRKGLSTIDAILKVRERIEEGLDAEETCLYHSIYLTLSIQSRGKR